MSALRWILLALGVLFFVGLSLREWRRSHQATRAAQLPGTRTDPVIDDLPGLTAVPAARSGQAQIPDGGRRLPVVDWSTATDDESADPASPANAPDARQRRDFEPTPVYSSSAVIIDQPALRIDWPPEATRRILSLRVVPARMDRLAGRAVRLALSASGFRHGPFSIYHLPGPDGRVLISAANLSQPGVLDPQRIDGQRLFGLNLFTVVPGPLEPSAALKRLLEVATTLAGRIDGQVQDERGQAVELAEIAILQERLLGQTQRLGGGAEKPH
ncbi:MAG TPA: cell division protein ZipA C-terminal FtsZ-binding domain-containing protein [Steroidobacteraceae bacterium]